MKWKRIFGGLLLLLGLTLGMYTAFAGAEHIRVQAPEAVELITGQLYTLELSEVFSDADSHALQFSLDNGEYGSQTKVTDGQLIFSIGEAGTYQPVITAVCENGETACCQLEIHVKESPKGDESQYGYDETDAECVTVYVTISNDGIPVKGNDVNQTILSHLEVKLPYFDLANYGMIEYYRYETNEGFGPYINDHLIRRPTTLHLYLYLLERYYMGLEESLCGMGVSELFNYAQETSVEYMDGGLAYNSDGMKALAISGGATSLYMVNFWGHDENLMYYRNHVYPLMSPGWGATSDYMLLSDGDTIDLAMFSNWDFYKYGGFTRFEEDEYRLNTGEKLEFGVWKRDTLAVTDGGAESEILMDNMDVAVYSENWEEIASPEMMENGKYCCTFENPGTYYLMALDPERATRGACFAPATAKIIVSGDVHEKLTGDVNGNGVLDEQDVSLLYEAVKTGGNLSADMLRAMDINQDGKISVRDVTALYVLLKQNDT